MEKINILIIGAGMVGLAIAAKISERNKGVFLVEKNAKYGQETSTHNSGVIHSGIHYPPTSLKSHLCVKGNSMIYEICEKFNVPYRKLGKLTVAVNEDEITELERLMERGEKNGVIGLELLGKRAAKKLEPYIDVEGALYSRSTGIVEPDELMNIFYAQSFKNGAVLSLKTEVKRLRKVKDGYEVGGVSASENFTVKAKTIINCAGLFADEIAKMVGIDVENSNYIQHFWKGDYFRVVGKLPVQRLIYPVPKGAGLGIHLTLDVGNTVRLGPNAYSVNNIDYKVNSNEEEFQEDVERFFPSIYEYQLVPDFAGIRPKLQGSTDGFRDFIIRHETDKDLFGLINLIGIESPGLTSAPAISELVNEIYEVEIKN